MNNSSEDESAFSAISRIPIAPFSAFLNDLNRPFFLNNLRPSDEIVKSGLYFPDAIIAPEKIPIKLFECPAYNRSKIILNDPPIKAITHEYDDFMLKVIEDCYENPPIDAKENQMTIPKPFNSTPTKIIPLKPSINDTPSSIKVKLNVANGSVSHIYASEVLKKLVKEESFVNPLCFDCVQDLSQIARVIKSFVSSPLQNGDLAIFESISPSLFGYIEGFLEHLDQSSESIDSIKMIYCISLIGLLNIYRLSSKDSLKNYNSFDLVMRLYSIDKSGSSDLILSSVIESYVILLNKFKVHDSEISSYSSHLFKLCFEAPGILSKTSSIIALAQVFSKYPEYRSFIIDQLLIKSTDSENGEIQRQCSVIIIVCLQALCQSEDYGNSKISLITSILTSCLSFSWKGEGNELPKASSIFFIMMEELQNIYTDFSWPIVATVLNQCTIQIFHYLLKDESTNSSASSKGSLMLKLRLLDVLSNISKVILSSSNSGSYEKSSVWHSISQNLLFNTILSPKLAFEILNQSAGTFDQEFYKNFLISGSLSKIPERVTGLFIKLISCEVVQLRSKVIKNLFNLACSSQLCKSNYDALKANILIKASDPSISVRDAVLEFISKLIFTPPSFETDQTDLIQSVLSRIKDRGVSVRKRAVKIVGEIFQKGICVTLEIKLNCVGTLISHINDEDDDTIVDLIFKTLKEQWIMCFIGKDFITSLPAAQRKIVTKFADEIVQVINFLQFDIKSLQDFLGRFLIDESIKKEYSIFFAGTVEVLLENLLQSLEGNDLKGLKGTLESIYLFSESNPQCLENHLGLLQNLIRFEDSDISLLAIKLVACVIPIASLTEMKKLQDFEKDLLRLIYRGSEFIVKLSIEVLYHYVNNCSHQYGTLSSLWQRFTEYLRTKVQDGLEIDPSTVPHICRAILATGVLCAQSARHRELEFGMKDFHSGAQAHCLLEFVSYFSNSCNNFIKCCTIQAFGSLILACPQVSISSSQIVRSLIKTCLSEDEDDSCKFKMLGIFDEMVKIFNLDTTVTQTAENNTKNNILAMEGDESYFSALIQEHFDKISNCIVVSGTLEVRATALKICSTSAILGLVNPQLIIPYLAIGLNSENDHIQAYSRNGYERLLTRYPSMMSKDLLTPCKLLYRQLSADSEYNNVLKSSTLASNSSKLSFYYSSLRGKTGKTGIEALNGIFSLFEEIVTSKLSKEFDDEFIKFLIETTIMLPFSNSDEVLNCLQKIQAIFSLGSSTTSNGFLRNQFILFNGLSYSVNYLMKCYPQILGMSIKIEEEGNFENSMNCTNSKNLTRNNLIQFEFPIINETNFTNEMIQEIISKQDAIPNLLLQEPKIFKRRQRSNETSNFNIYNNDEIEIEDDISSLLVDDDEISESHTSDDDEDHELEILKQFSSKRSNPSQNDQKPSHSKKLKPQKKRN